MYKLDKKVSYDFVKIELYIVHKLDNHHIVSYN
jgi:hypothetical protein